MADPAPSTDAALGQLIVLSFDLLDSEIDAIPDRIAAVLTRPDVYKAIEKSLLDFAKTRDASATSQLTDEEARKLRDSVLKAGGSAASDAYLDQIKASSRYKSVLSQLDLFKKAAASSSLGVWVDRNKGVLYVVGAALVLGGSTVLYLTKSGGPVADTISGELQKHSIDVVTVGALKLSVSDIEFRPSAQILGAKLVGQLKWDRVSVQLKLQLVASGADVQKVNGEAVVKVGVVNFTAIAGRDFAKPNVDLSLRINANLDNVKLGVGAHFSDGGLRGSGSIGYDLNKKTSIKIEGSGGRGADGRDEYRGVASLEFRL